MEDASSAEEGLERGQPEIEARKSPNHSRLRAAVEKANADPSQYEAGSHSDPAVARLQSELASQFRRQNELVERFERQVKAADRIGKGLNGAALSTASNRFGLHSPASTVLDLDGEAPASRLLSRMGIGLPNPLLRSVAEPAGLFPISHMGGKGSVHSALIASGSLGTRRPTFGRVLALTESQMPGAASKNLSAHSLVRRMLGPSAIAPHSPMGQVLRFAKGEGAAMRSFRQTTLKRNEQLLGMNRAMANALEPLGALTKALSGSREVRKLLADVDYWARELESTEVTLSDFALDEVSSVAPSTRDLIWESDDLEEELEAMHLELISALTEARFPVDHVEKLVVLIEPVFALLRYAIRGERGFVRSAFCHLYLVYEYLETKASGLKMPKDLKQLAGDFGNNRGLRHVKNHNLRDFASPEEVLESILSMVPLLTQQLRFHRMDEYR